MYISTDVDSGSDHQGPREEWTVKQHQSAGNRANRTRGRQAIRPVGSGRDGEGRWRCSMDEGDGDDQWLA